jgi:hypothetical protein
MLAELTPHMTQKFPLGELFVCLLGVSLPPDVYVCGRFALCNIEYACDSPLDSHSVSNLPLVLDSQDLHPSLPF